MHRLRLAALALLGAAASCSDVTGPRKQITQDLHAAHDRWRAQKLHTYAFTLQRSCFCVNVHPLYVFVQNDTVAGVLDLETGAQVDPQLGETVEGLFTFVQSALDSRAAVLQVQYDPVRGYPTQIDYDGSTQIADDELSLHASDVHPVAPPP